MKRPLSLVICLLVPFSVLLIGLIWAGAYAYYEFPKLNVENGRGVVSPGFDLALGEPGQYSIRLHSYGTFEGQTYENSGEMPEGARVMVTDKKSGDKLEVNQIVIGSKSVPGELAVVIGKFNIFRKSEIEITGVGFGEAALISVAKSNDSARMRTLISFASILLLTLFVSIVTLIVLLHRRSQVIASEPH